MFPAAEAAAELLICVTGPVVFPGLSTSTEMFWFVGFVWVDVELASADCWLQAH